MATSLALQFALLVRIPMVIEMRVPIAAGHQPARCVGAETFFGNARHPSHPSATPPKTGCCSLVAATIRKTIRQSRFGHSDRRRRQVERSLSLPLQVRPFAT